MVDVPTISLNFFSPSKVIYFFLMRQENARFNGTIKTKTKTEPSLIFFIKDLNAVYPLAIYAESSGYKKLIIVNKGGRSAAVIIHMRDSLPCLSL